MEDRGSFRFRAENGFGSPVARIAKALEYSKSLQSLDLSWNNVGDAGAMALGASLKLDGNTSLTSLDLTHNHIAERGTMVIGDMCKENTALKRLKLDENPIGERGGRAILRAYKAQLMYKIDREISMVKTNFVRHCLCLVPLLPLRVGHCLSFVRHCLCLVLLLPSWVRHCLSFVRHCIGLVSLLHSWVRHSFPGGPQRLRDELALHTVNGKDQTKAGEDGAVVKTNKGLFDPSVAGGKYELHLDDPYDRMVAWELVALAWAEAGENWFDETLNNQKFSLPEPGEGVVWDRTHYNLPTDGVLRVRYQSTKRKPKMADIVDRRLLSRLYDLMNDRTVTDHGLSLLKMASVEWFFSAEVPLRCHSLTFHRLSTACP